MTLWLILQMVAAIPMVVMPFVMQARESWRPPMNTPTLGTFGIVMMASFYFVVAGMVNGGIAGVRLGWPWYGTGVLSAGATAIGVVGAYKVLYVMAVRGGKALTVMGGVVLGAMVAGFAAAPFLVGR